MANQFGNAQATCRAICLETWSQDGWLHRCGLYGSARCVRPGSGQAPRACELTQALIHSASAPPAWLFDRGGSGPGTGLRPRVPARASATTPGGNDLPASQACRLVPPARPPRVARRCAGAGHAIPSEAVACIDQNFGIPVGAVDVATRRAARDDTSPGRRPAARSCRERSGGRPEFEEVMP